MGDGDRQLIWTGGYNGDGQGRRWQWEAVMDNGGTTVTVMATGKVDGWAMVTGDYEGQWRKMMGNRNGRQAS